MIRSSSGSALPQNRHFGSCPSLGLSAMLTALGVLMKAGVATLRPLSDQEQPEVSPHCVHTEHEPDGIVGAPQYWQGSNSGSSTGSIR